MTSYINSQIDTNLGIKPGTKILFANFPADGHFNPLTGLAVQLQRKGCDVRWYTSKTFEEKVTNLHIPFYPLKKALDVNAANINDVFPQRLQHKSGISRLVFDLIHAFILRSPEYFEDIKEIRKEFEFDLMICDVAFGAIPFVREKMGIPVISISVFPLTETSKDLAPNGLGLMPSYSFFGKVKQSLLRVVAQKILFRKPNIIMHKMLRHYGIDAGKAFLFDLLIQKSNLVLQSGTPSFEYKRSDLSAHIHFVGPLLPYISKKNRTAWFNEKLADYEKVILVTQGTVEKDVRKLIIPILEAFKNSDRLVVVTTGGAQTKELREQYSQENVIIEDFIPFDAVMPYADVYVSNGGYGGVLLSIEHQLPMVVAGINEGKNEINARIGYFNLGINLDTENPTQQQLKKAVEDVLRDRKYNKNVNKLHEEFEHYNPKQLVPYYVANLLEDEYGGAKTFRKQTADSVY